MLWSPADATESERQFPTLYDLGLRVRPINQEGLDSDDIDDITLETAVQKKKKSQRYVNQMQGSVRIFSRKENSQERRKFLNRLADARDHLLHLYIPGRPEDTPELHQHPSSGVKELANTLHKLLYRHWNCKCPHRWRREARLSLTRHRIFLLKAPSRIRSTADFEVLLPICRENSEWKVTNVQVDSPS